jgi:hypothetical protein
MLPVREKRASRGARAYPWVPVDFISTPNSFVPIVLIHSYKAARFLKYWNYWLLDPVHEYHEMLQKLGHFLGLFFRNRPPPHHFAKNQPNFIKIASKFIIFNELSSGTKKSLIRYELTEIR